MTTTRFIRKHGQFAGSIGAGKNVVPVSVRPVTVRLLPVERRIPVSEVLVATEPGYRIVYDASGNLTRRPAGVPLHRNEWAGARIKTLGVVARFRYREHIRAAIAAAWQKEAARSHDVVTLAGLHARMLDLVAVKTFSA